MHRATRRNVVLQHVVRTFTSLSTSHLSTENPVQIRLHPFVPDLIQLCHVCVLLQITLFNQEPPSLLKFIDG